MQEKVVGLIYKHGVKHYKKHGDFFIVQGDEEYLALDTWNGYINIIKGTFNGGDTFHQGCVLATRNNRDVKATRYSMGLAYQFILKWGLGEQKQ